MDDISIISPQLAAPDRRLATLELAAPGKKMFTLMLEKMVISTINGIFCLLLLGPRLLALPQY
jgi:hypothetical protein